MTTLPKRLMPWLVPVGLVFNLGGAGLVVWSDVAFIFIEADGRSATVLGRVFVKTIVYSL